MSVMKVSVISIIGKMDRLNDVVEACDKFHNFHPDNALSFFSDTNGFTPLNEANPFSPVLQRLKETLGQLGKQPLAPDPAGEPMDEAALTQYVDWFSGQVEALQQQKQALLQEQEGHSGSIEQLARFSGLDIDTSAIFACEYIKVRFGRLPRESYEKLQAYSDNPYVLFFPCTHSEDYYWGVYFSPIDSVDEVDRIFSGLYFERLWIPATADTPEHAVELLTQMNEKLGENIRQVEEKLSLLWEEEASRASCAYHLLEHRSMIAETRRYAAKYGENFILTGWIFTSQQSKLLKALDKIETVEYSLEDGDKQLNHSPPVQLKNKKPFRCFEFFVDMYGLPDYNEVDPTNFVALTYTLLFGIMFGDLGQGLVLALAGWLMWRLKRMPIGKILMPCGISAAFFGLVFGSVFGYENMLNPLYHALFGLEEKPIEVMEPASTNMIIYAAVGIGCLLLIIAMGINIYSCFRRRDIGQAIFGSNGIAGLVLYLALVVGLVGQLVLNVAILTPLYIIFLIGVPLVCLFLSEPLVKLANGRKDWKPEKWGEFCMQSFFELFEGLLSYVTNTMSFLRVGAFVLVHTGMMMVVFTLAEMAPGVGNLAIVIIGNVVVMGMEALLVAIQVLRLEFYELFSRCFHGGGRPFRPISAGADS